MFNSRPTNYYIESAGLSRQPSWFIQLVPDFNVIQQITLCVDDIWIIALGFYIDGVYPQPGSVENARTVNWVQRT